jgi:hypothetical protein
MFEAPIHPLQRRDNLSPRLLRELQGVDLGVGIYRGIHIRIDRQCITPLADGNDSLDDRPITDQTHSDVAAVALPRQVDKRSEAADSQEVQLIRINHQQARRSSVRGLVQ